MGFWLTCAVGHALTGGIDGLLARLPDLLIHTVLAAGAVSITANTTGTSADGEQVL